MNLYEKIRIILTHAGLGEHEILFYVTVLKNPYSTINALAKKSGLSKNKAYAIFDSLRELGIVGRAEGNATIIPVSFNNLINILNKKSRQLGRIADDLARINKVVPFLREVKSQSGVHVYDSINEIKENYLDLLGLDWENTWAYGSFEMFAKEIDGEIESKFVSTRVKKGRKARAVMTDIGPITRELVKHDANEMRSSRFLESSEIKNKWLHVFPENNLMMMWSKDPASGKFSGIAVDNKEIADFHKQLFEANWREAGMR